MEGIPAPTRYSPLCCGCQHQNHPAEGCGCDCHDHLAGRCCEICGKVLEDGDRSAGRCDGCGHSLEV